ncbi:MAG: amidase [Solirubrobacteraceae bacterium]
MVGTIRQTSDLLRGGELRACALLESALAAVAQCEPTLRAYSYVPADGARRAAELADRELATGRWRGPLHGIPVTIKDVIDTADAPTEAGSRALAGRRPERDATVVRLLREAGAVVLGKTVTHEFAYGQNTLATRNARDPLREPGGSSAGSAVTVAAGAVPVALGTDTGGSVRAPASLNGVVGLKPTYGRISRHGVFPVSPTLDAVGILAGTAWDVAAVLTVLAGRDEHDPTTLDEPHGDYILGLDEPINGLRVGVVRELVEQPSAEEQVQAAVTSSLRLLGELGATLIDVDGAFFADAATIGMAISLVDAATVHERLVAERGDSYDPGTRAMIDAGNLVSGPEYVRALRARSRLIGGLRALFGRERLDVLALPSLPCVAPPAGELAADMLGGQPNSLAAFLRYQFLANVAGRPAVSVPCHAQRGLPVGLQLIGRPLAEHLLLRINHQHDEAIKSAIDREGAGYA